MQRVKPINKEKILSQITKECEGLFALKLDEEAKEDLMLCLNVLSKIKNRKEIVNLNNTDHYYNERRNIN